MSFLSIPPITHTTPSSGVEVEGYPSSLSSSSSSFPPPSMPQATSFVELWMSTVAMLTITVAAITANGLVLTMFASRRGLRRCKNVYFASLALADFLVSLCMPVKLALDLHGGWADGWHCRGFQGVRQAAMYASFLSVFLITLDKWRSTHYPLSYRNKVTKRLAVTAVVVVWALSFLLYTLPLTWWANVTAIDRRPRPVDDLGSSSPPEEGRDERAGSRHPSLPQEEGGAYETIPENGRMFSPEIVCTEGYHLKFNLSVLSTTFLYVIPILVMFIFNVSLYLKIKWRKSVEVQRSTSVTDTYFMTLKKTALDIDSCVAAATDDPTKESLLKNSDTKPVNKHLAVAARGERRHSSLPAISPIMKGRTSSGRRVSMPEGNATGGCRYVGRKWSGCTSGMTGNTSPNPMANLGPRIHEDMVHDILVKQDKTVARCLCLLLALMVVCWAPHTAAMTTNANCSCVRQVTFTVTSWFNLLSHALNPVLYVLMNGQFKNVLKQWLIMERVHVFKMRDTLILKHLQREMVQGDDESNSKDKSPNPSAKNEHGSVPVLGKPENNSV